MTTARTIVEKTMYLQHVRTFSHTKTSILLRKEPNLFIVSAFMDYNERTL